MLFCRCEGKWDDVLYVNLFFELQNDYDVCKECGLIAGESGVLALEAGDKKPIKCCCLACSIGIRCNKYKEKGEEEEDVELLVGPSRGNEAVRNEQGMEAKGERGLDGRQRAQRNGDSSD